MRKVSRRELARVITKQLLEGISAEKVMRELAAYLVEHKAHNQADMILEDISFALQEATGHISVEITSAFLLNSETQRKLESYIRTASGAKTVETTIIADPALIGGVIVKTPGHEYDASVRRKLNLLARGEV